MKERKTGENWVFIFFSVNFISLFRYLKKTWFSCPKLKKNFFVIFCETEAQNFFFWKEAKQEKIRRKISFQKNGNRKIKQQKNTEQQAETSRPNKITTVVSLGFRFP